MEQLKPVLHLFKLNTHLLKNSIEGITDEKAAIRLNENTNNIAFILLHLLGSRQYIAKIIGLNIEIPGSEKYANAKKAEDITDFPKMEEMAKAWQDASDKILSALKSMSEESLLADSLVPLPGMDKSVLNALTFFMQHDAYHLGQIAFIRKYLGYGPMSYK